MEYLNQLFFSGNYIAALQWIDAIIYLIFLATVLYLLIFSLSSLRKKRDRYPTAPIKYRFAILIPAIDYTTIDLECIKTIANQSYAKDKFDIYVISKSLSSKSISDLEKLDVTCITYLNYPRENKANCLLTAVNYIESNDKIYDIIVTLNPNEKIGSIFLDKLNNTFYSGCSVAQTHKIVKSQKTAYDTLHAVKEEINNSIFRLGHTKLGFSSALNNSGMAFEYALFLEFIQTSQIDSVTKNLEQKILSEFIYIEYLSDVHVYEMETAIENTNKYDLLNNFSSQVSGFINGFKILPKALLDSNWDYCNKIFQWMLPPTIILVGLIFIFSLIFTYTDWTLSIKWWGLLVLLLVTYSISIPEKMINRKLTIAIFLSPFVLIRLIFNKIFSFNRKKKTYK
ncbi:MAG: glycosyltransferase family 2 protein [Massilibacteroides sp.]|nr:glycosyltransferase family 2 protein [Massilibacteroides sp.]